MRSFIILTFVLLTACTATENVPPARPSDRPQSVFTPSPDDVPSLLLAARTAAPMEGVNFRLQAATLMLDEDPARAGQILDDTPTGSAVQPAQLRRYLLLRARVALAQSDPNLALGWLSDVRMQDIPLDQSAQVTLGLLKSDAYLLLRSYLASARERVYIHSLLPRETQADNIESIYATLRELPAEVLHRAGEREITNEVRGWLSLAALAKRHQFDPARTVAELERWQGVWAGHPAATNLPRSLQILTEVVARQPRQIALLLPLNENLGVFGRAIRDGIIGAHYEASRDQENGSVIRVYDTTTIDIAEAVRTAIADGAELIIGPLDRDRVARAIETSAGDVPMIVLNRVSDAPSRPNVYQFGLAPEDEIVQVANQTWREGYRKALAIVPDTSWGARNFELFRYVWTGKGGTITDVARFGEDADYSDVIRQVLDVDESETRASELRRITGLNFQHEARRRQDIDFVLLLASPKQAGAINPTLDFYYAEDLPVYATSHVHEHNAESMDLMDLNRIRFCDMPWKLVTPSSVQRAVVSAWPGAEGALAPFYALGVDAYHLYPRLRQLETIKDEKAFGVTGILNMTNRVIQRRLMWAQFRDGEVVAQPLAVSAE